jgi:predicted HicB family RNase H-like nuclease
MAVMAKKKTSQDRPKRLAIHLSEEWHEVAQKLAAKARQPINWYVMEFLKKEAEAAGINTPAAPWETSFDDE